jgi:hypothetical protein
MQGSRIELRQYADVVQTTVKTVADGNVHETVFASERDGRLGSQLGQRAQPTTTSSAHDDTKYLWFHGSNLIMPRHHGIDEACL